LPNAGLSEIARYRVPTSLELEDRVEREVVLYRVTPSTLVPAVTEPHPRS
jgi:hypothetical protein